MNNDNDNSVHLLQKYGILMEFDIVNVTSLESFMETYGKIANSSDDISELKNVSKLLKKKEKDIPGFIIKNQEGGEDNPELNRIGYALIEFIMKKTQDPADWAYILNYVIKKLGLELGDAPDEEDDKE
jgi:hypothetical protein